MIRNSKLAENESRLEVTEEEGNGEGEGRGFEKTLTFYTHILLTF